VYQISGQSDNKFAFYDNFYCLTKRRKTNQQKKQQEIKQRKSANFEGSYVGNTWLKFGM